MPSQNQSLDRLTIYILRLASVGVGFASFVWLFKAGTPVFMPLIFALVVGVVFAPLANFFERLGAPSVVGALAVLLVVLTSISLGIYILYPVIAEFLLRIPVMWLELKEAFSGLKSTMENVENMQSQVAETLSSGSSAVAAIENAPQVDVPSVTDILRYIPAFAAQILVSIGILYFFLLTRLDLYACVDKSSSSLTGQALRRAEAEVSRYFLTITAINGCFGVLVALMLSAYGMPNAAYWGVGAFLVNYVLYLGPISFAVILLMGGLIVFDGAISILPAVTYLLMNMTEGQFVTPSLVGKQMSVNPLLIFLSLVFWLWMWGPLGGVIAIPLLVWLRQISKARDTQDQYETVETQLFDTNNPQVETPGHKVTYASAE
ncbi:MAG: AI-2E family transporter [Roseobacter sp.]